MKGFLVLIFTSLLLTSCLSLNKSILSDSSPTIENPDYQTYFIGSNRDLPPELSNSLESVISSRMKALGYHQSEENPDLFVNYEIYQSSFSTSLLEILETKEVGKRNKLRRYMFKHGSIYITFFNEENRKVVWRGFSDGSSLNPRIVKAKTYEIMDHYRVLAAPENIVSALD